jgi:hypothetical protein
MRTETAAILGLALAVVFPTPAPATDAPKTLRVIAPEAPVLAGGKVIATLKKGAEVTEAGWIAVELTIDGKVVRGWMRASDLGPSKPDVPEIPTLPPLPPAGLDPEPANSGLVIQALSAADPIRNSKKTNHRNRVFPRFLTEPGGGPSRLTAEQVAALERVGRNRDFGDRRDRVAYIRSLINLAGAKKAGEIGVIFYGMSGRPEYVWPAPPGYVKPPGPKTLGGKRLWWRRRLLESVCRNHDAWEQYRIPLSDGSVDLSVDQRKKLTMIPQMQGSWPAKLRVMAKITPLDVRLYCNTRGRVAIDDIIRRFGTADKTYQGVICNLPEFRIAASPDNNIRGTWHIYGSIRLGVLPDGRILAIRVNGPKWRAEEEAWVGE